MKKILTSLALIFAVFAVKAAQYPSVQSPPQARFSLKTDSLPTVFALGQYDGAPFDALKAECESQLLDVCRKDMEMAYYLWIHMQKRMESHAAKTGFDLTGVKVWFYAFFNKDGSIQHLAYYPKPNSRNIKSEEMTAFLFDFCKMYKLPLTADRCFQHYSFANFPVMVEKPSATFINTGGKD